MGYCKVREGGGGCIVGSEKAGWGIVESEKEVVGVL